MKEPTDSQFSRRTANFVSRGGEKLSAALDAFVVNVAGLVCADLGSHVGGFVDCLLQRGAVRVYSVDTSYGTLAWTLRKDSRVVVLERTNAMHVSLPQPVDLITIDVGWTPQAKILPQAVTLLKPTGVIVSLVKPHYEAPASELVDGVLPDERCGMVLDRVLQEVEAMGLKVVARCESPLRGHAGNQEFFLQLGRVG